MGSVSIHFGLGTHCRKVEVLSVIIISNNNIDSTYQLSSMHTVRPSPKCFTCLVYLILEVSLETDVPTIFIEQTGKVSHPL